LVLGGPAKRLYLVASAAIGWPATSGASFIRLDLRWCEPRRLVVYSKVHSAWSLNGPSK
jgi:hypothetical protein